MSDKKWNKWDTAWLGLLLSLSLGLAGGAITSLVVGNFVTAIAMLFGFFIFGLCSGAGVCTWAGQRPQYKWDDLSLEEQIYLVKHTFPSLTPLTYNQDEKYWRKVRSEKAKMALLHLQPEMPAPVATIIPEQDLILTGYRRFRLSLDEHGHVLQGSFGTTWPTQTLVARCADQGDCQEHLMSASCGCGIYSFRDRLDNDWKAGDGFCVEAEVTNSGMIHVFERGYRSQEATITRLWVHLPQGLTVDLCEALRARYGVPVELVETTENPFDLPCPVWGVSSQQIQYAQNYLDQPLSSSLPCMYCRKYPAMVNLSYCVHCALGVKSSPLITPGV